MGAALTVGVRRGGLLMSLLVLPLYLPTLVLGARAVERASSGLDWSAPLILQVAVTLTAREMDILGLLIARPDNIVARPALVDQVYGVGMDVSDRTLDSHLRNLRANITTSSTFGTAVSAAPSASTGAAVSD